MMLGIMGSISDGRFPSFYCERSHLGIIVGMVGIMG